MVVGTFLSTYKTLCPDRSFQNLSKAVPQVARKLDMEVAFEKVANSECSQEVTEENIPAMIENFPW